MKLQQLGLGDHEEPFNTQQAHGISDRNRCRARKPMPIADQGDRNKP